MPASRPSVRPSLLALLTALGAACGGDGGTEPVAPPPPPPPPPVGARVVAGGAVDDTVLAQPLQAFVVEVRREGGTLASGVTVRFEARPPADSARRFERAVHVCTLSAPTCGPAESGYGDSQFAADTTDATGRAKAILRLGTVAGPARVVFSVPELGLRDSATFTVRPGAAAALRFTTRDTTLYVGASVTLGAAVRDRFGNPRTDAVTMSADASDVADVSGTGTVTGRQFGRVMVRAQAGGARDSAFVSVVPRGRLVGWVGFDPVTQRAQVVTVDMDGSNLRRIAPVSNILGVYPSWSATGETIGFHSGTASNRVEAYTVDSSGANVRALSDGTGEFAEMVRFVAGGDAMFVVYDSRTGYSVWRAGADGSNRRRVGTLPELFGYGGYGAVDISPDGGRVVYASPLGVLMLADLASATTRPLGIVGSAPRWSPAGDEIAYLAEGGSLAVARFDGTGARVLSQSRLLTGIAWSPGGAYLLARSSEGGLRLVRAADGLTITMRLGVDLMEPSWR